MYGWKPFNAFDAIVHGVNAAQAIRGQHAANVAAALKNKYLPQQMQILAENARARQEAVAQSQKRFGPGYVLHRYLTTPFGQSLLAHNPGLARNIAQYVQQTAQTVGAPGTGSSPLSVVSRGPSPAGGSPVSATPPTGTQISPAQIHAGQVATSQELLKKTTDPQARAKLLYAANIDKTLAQIDPDALTQYAGFAGSLEKLAQEGLAPFSKESKNYDNYQSNVSLTKLLAKQVRQFYGDSIRPTVAKGLKELSNPATWKDNPKLAKKKYNTFVNLLRRETQTYRSAMKAPGIYYGATPGELATAGASVASSSPAEIPAGNIRVIRPDGKVGYIPASQLALALSQKYKRA